jgi:hypothetical protein
VRDLTTEYLGVKRVPVEEDGLGVEVLAVQEDEETGGRVHAELTGSDQKEATELPQHSASLC